MKTKSITLLLAVAAGLTVPTMAGTIGVNFSAATQPVLATDAPGIVGGDDWNNIAGATGSGVILQDDSATPTTATLDFTSVFQYGGFAATATANTGTNTMYRGGIGGSGSSNEAIVTISNIPYAKYDLYVFASQDTTSTHQLSISDGTTTYYYRGNGSRNSAAASLLKTTSTTSGSPTVGPAQYQLLAERTSSSVTLTTGGSIGGTISNQIFGVHIVEIPSGTPALTGAAVGNITLATADASATLTEANAEVTLFWAESDYGTNLGDWQTNGSSDVLGAQVVGPVSGSITGLSGDTGYFCRFHAVNTSPNPDLDGWSGLVTFVTPLAGKSVSDLAATGYSAFEVDLTWTDNFATETGYIIERSPAGTNAWTTVATVPAGTQFHTDIHTGLTPATGYDYRVLATNDNGDSDPSNVASATTSAATPLVTQLLVNFDGSLAGGIYTPDAAEIDTTASFKANGNPVVTGGRATINPGNPGGNQGFDFNPISLGSLNSQNWVAEALVTFQSIGTAQSPTIIDVQGNCGVRFLYPYNDALEMIYYNGNTIERETTGLPPLGSRVHLAFAWNASTATLTGYVNGASFGTVSQGAFTTPDPTDVSFGYFGRVGFQNRGTDAVFDAVAFQSGTATFNPITGFLILPPGTSYSAWIGGYPGVGGQNGFSHDPDGDHLANGLEALFGTDPSVWNAGLAQVSTNGTVTTFTHPQADPPLNDVTGSYEWSLDLATWYAGDGVEGPLGGPTVNIPTVTPVGGTATVTATASSALGTLFVRAAASH